VGIVFRAGLLPHGKTEERHGRVASATKDKDKSHDESSPLPRDSAVANGTADKPAARRRARQVLIREREGPLSEGGHCRLAEIAVSAVRALRVRRRDAEESRSTRHSARRATRSPLRGGRPQGGVLPGTAEQRFPAAQDTYRATVGAALDRRRRVLAPTAVGSLDSSYGPGTLAFPTSWWDRTRTAGWGGGGWCGLGIGVVEGWLFGRRGGEWWGGRGGWGGGRDAGWLGEGGRGVVGGSVGGGGGGGGGVGWCAGLGCMGWVCWRGGGVLVAGGGCRGGLGVWGGGGGCWGGGGVWVVVGGGGGGGGRFSFVWRRRTTTWARASAVRRPDTARRSASSPSAHGPRSRVGYPSARAPWWSSRARGSRPERSPSGSPPRAGRWSHDRPPRGGPARSWPSATPAGPGHRLDAGSDEARGVKRPKSSRSRAKSALRGPGRHDHRRPPADRETTSRPRPRRPSPLPFPSRNAAAVVLDVTAATPHLQRGCPHPPRSPVEPAPAGGRAPGARPAARPAPYRSPSTPAPELILYLLWGAG